MATLRPSIAVPTLKVETRKPSVGYRQRTTPFDAGIGLFSTICAKTWRCASSTNATLPAVRDPLNRTSARLGIAMGQPLRILV